MLLTLEKVKTADIDVLSFLDVWTIACSNLKDKLIVAIYEWTIVPITTGLSQTLKYRTYFCNVVDELGRPIDRELALAVSWRIEFPNPEQHMFLLIWDPATEQLNILLEAHGHSWPSFLRTCAQALDQTDKTYRSNWRRA